MIAHKVLFDIWAAAAGGWLFIENSLLIGRMESDEGHPITRIMRWGKRKFEAYNVVTCVALKLLLCLVLCIGGFIPCLLSAALWPVSVPIYILSNMDWKKLRGRK
ncbi:TPA: hypothetical protein ACNEJR_003723 [Escherichia coli]|nr:hypothetical protein [Salmonella enterica subsp. enterica serovar Enteritidis]